MTESPGTSTPPHLVQVHYRGLQKVSYGYIEGEEVIEVDAGEDAQGMDWKSSVTFALTIMVNHIVRDRFVRVTHARVDCLTKDGTQIYSAILYRGIVMG